MNKKVKNAILYAILLIMLFISTFSKMFDVSNIWKPQNNGNTSFNGIYFEKPGNVYNLKVVRSLATENGSDKLQYDIEFEYSGQPSNMRIIGDVSQQAFFGDGVVPKHSNVVLKDQYDEINRMLFNEKLHLRDYYKKMPEYNFASNSSIRVPLTDNEDVNTYKFRLTYTPRYLVSGNDNVIGKMGVFLTNGRVDKFTDSSYELKSETSKFTNAGMQVYTLEVFDDAKLGRMDTFKNINNVIFIMSVIGMVILVAASKKINEFAAIGLMFISILTFYKFFGVGVSPKATYTALPIMAFITVLLGKQMPKDKIEFGKYDFSQALVGAVIFSIISILVFVLPVAA
ncbi:MAG: hypothetical protein GXZ08_09300 [Tissierellia bacterium]|nr:hypothetical protein [Tissierellia bacterium]